MSSRGSGLGRQSTTFSLCSLYAKRSTAYGLDGPVIESRWGEIFRTCPDRP